MRKKWRKRLPSVLSRAFADQGLTFIMYPAILRELHKEGLSMLPVQSSLPAFFSVSFASEEEMMDASFPDVTSTIKKSNMQATKRS
jgi:hypothetical protein